MFKLDDLELFGSKLSSLARGNSMSRALLGESKEISFSSKLKGFWEKLLFSHANRARLFML
jgi:hypothetical protein